MERSQWTSRDAGQQTDASVPKDVEVQTTCMKSQEVQTDDTMMARDSDSHDCAALAGFLRRVTPDVLLQLDRNLTSHAFDCLDGHSHLDSDDEDGKTKLLHVLTCDRFNAEEVMICSSFSWNSTGSVIAVSCCAAVHEGWCCHGTAGLAVWNLNRRDFSGSKPIAFHEFTACLTCVRFHPTEPALIAGGSHNGAVCLWSLSREDDALVFAGNSDRSGFRHAEQVTSLNWVKDGHSAGTFSLVSSGLDGRILVWKLTQRNTRLELDKAFIVLVQNIPKALGAKSRWNSGEVGVLDLSFCHEDPNLFFAVLEGGGLVQCSLESQVPVAGLPVESAVPLLSPVVLVLTPHPGQVTAIGCSPFERNLVASCGLDGELRFYSVVQPGPPVSTVNYSDPLESLCWSPVCPLLVVTATSTGEVVVFKVQHRDHCRPIHRFGSAEEESLGYSKVLFNCKELMAVLGKRNEAQIWQLSEEFLESAPQDGKILNDLCKSMA